MLICVFTSRGYLKGHRVRISAGNKVICIYPCLTFQTFVYQNESMIVSPPIAIVQGCQSYYQLHRHNFIGLLSKSQNLIGCYGYKKCDFFKNVKKSSPNKHKGREANTLPTCL